MKESNSFFELIYSSGGKALSSTLLTARKNSNGENRFWNEFLNDTTKEHSVKNQFNFDDGHYKPSRRSMGT